MSRTSRYLSHSLTVCCWSKQLRWKWNQHQSKVGHLYTIWVTSIAWNQMPHNMMATTKKVRQLASCEILIWSQSWAWYCKAKRLLISKSLNPINNDVYREQSLRRHIIIMITFIMSALLYSHSCNNVMLVSDAFAIMYRVNNLIIVPSFFCLTRHLHKLH